MTYRFCPGCGAELSKRHGLLPVCLDGKHTFVCFVCENKLYNDSTEPYGQAPKPTVIPCHECGGHVWQDDKYFRENHELTCSCHVYYVAPKPAPWITCPGCGHPAPGHLPTCGAYRKLRPLSETKDAPVANNPHWQELPKPDHVAFKHGYKVGDRIKLDESVVYVTEVIDDFSFKHSTDPPDRIKELREKYNILAPYPLCLSGDHEAEAEVTTYRADINELLDMLAKALKFWGVGVLESQLKVARAALEAKDKEIEEVRDAMKFWADKVPVRDKEIKQLKAALEATSKENEQLRIDNHENHKHNSNLYSQFSDATDEVRSLNAKLARVDDQDEIIDEQNEIISELRSELKAKDDVEVDRAVEFLMRHGLKPDECDKIVVDSAAKDESKDEKLHRVRAYAELRGENKALRLILEKMTGKT